jgi:predicted glycoside hydrolase/deacetylase ChbG (UPF0249 family)
MKRIAICIDDFGLHPAVDEAILALVEKGRVTATSCMVGAPAWKQDTPRLKAPFDAGRVDAGLHFDLTEHPIDAGLREDLGTLMRNAIVRSLDRARIRSELGRQLDAFEAAMGRAPSHVDGHQHVHTFPLIRELVVHELERRYSASARPWLRSTRGAARGGIKGRIIEAMGSKALERLAREHGFAHNASLLGIYDFQGGAQRYRTLLQQWLRESRDRDLIMGHVATAIVPGDEIAQARVDEYAVFASDGFDAMLREAQVALGRLGGGIVG